MELCTVHGLGEHIGRYQHVAEYLTAASYAFIGFDLRGNGRSDGKPGHAAKYELLLDDVGLMLENAEKHYPGVPIFLYGHSLGGNLVLTYALRRQPTLQGIIATSPILRVAFDPPAWKMIVGRLLYTLWPSFSMVNEVDPAALSHDTAIVDAYISDPLVHDRITSRLGMDMLDAGEWLLEHADELKLPLLLMHGKEDRLCSPHASELFAEKAKRSCSLVLWDGFYHETHNEVDGERVLVEMVGWMEARK
jgi:alpha-beta hydrolase superfamily lysophospholipase